MSWHAEYLGGPHSYDWVEQVQVQNWQERVNNSAANNLVLGFELNPVLTAGRRVSHQEFSQVSAQVNKQKITCEVARADRGGEWTAHAPGQLVIYFIAKIPRGQIARFVESILKFNQSFLQKFFAIETLPTDFQNPGLFTAQGKVLSVGLRFEQGVTRHGIALNVCNDTGLFRHIAVCGVKGQAITTMALECEAAPARSDVAITPARVFKLWSDDWLRWQSQNLLR